MWLRKMFVFAFSIYSLRFSGHCFSSLPTLFLFLLSPPVSLLFDDFVLRIHLPLLPYPFLLTIIYALAINCFSLSLFAYDRCLLPALAVASFLAFFSTSFPFDPAVNIFISSQPSTFDALFVSCGSISFFFVLFFPIFLCTSINYFSLTPEASFAPFLPLPLLFLAVYLYFPNLV